MGTAVVLWTVILAVFAILRHQRLNSSAYDLAIQSQVIWNSGHGHLFASSLEVRNYLGDHVQPILLLLAPLYRLWSRPEILLIIQALALTSGAIPVYRLACRHLHHKRLAFLFGLTFLLYPALGFMNRFDFHLVIFSIPLLLFALDAWDEGRFAAAHFFMLLALFCKEEIGLTICMVGLYALLIRKQKRLGVVWFGVGLIWSLVALFVIIPTFRGVSSDTLARYAWLGGDPATQLHTLLFKPTVVWQHLYEPERSKVLLRLLLPLGFLSLLAPAVLLIGAPVLAYNLLSAVPSQSSIYFHYMAPFVPFVFIAAILGAAWLKQRSGPRFPLMVGALLVLGTGAAWLVDNPFTQVIADPYFRVYGLERLLDPAPFAAARQMLPDEAPVATTMAFAPHLSTRPEVDLFYYKGKREAQVYDYQPTEYLLLHLNDFRWGENPRVYYAMIETAVGRDGYEAIYYQDDVALLRQNISPRPETGAMLQRLLELAEGGGKYAPTGPETIAWIQQRWQMATLPPEAVPQETLFDNHVALLGYRLQPTTPVPGGTICVTLYWQSQVPVTDETHIFVHLAAADGYVHAQRDTSGVMDFFPVTEWVPGSIVGDLHCLVIPSGLPVGVYHLRIGLYESSTGQRAAVLSTGANSFSEDAVDLTDILIQP